MQTQEQFAAQPRVTSQTDRILEHLTERPFQWVPMIELGELVGAWAVHSRIADVRRRVRQAGHGEVENKQQVSEYTGQRLSWYRYVPADARKGESDETD